MISSLIDGHTVKGSGAGTFAKGDVKNSYLLFECKASKTRLPKIPSYGIFAKVVRESMNQHRVPGVSTAWISGTSPTDLEVQDVRFFLPWCMVNDLKMKLETFEAIPEEKSVFTHMTTWVEVDLHDFKNILKAKRWKTEEKKSGSPRKKRWK